MEEGKRALESVRGQNEALESGKLCTVSIRNSTCKEINWVNKKQERKQKVQTHNWRKNKKGSDFRFLDGGERCSGSTGFRKRLQSDTRWLPFSFFFFYFVVLFMRVWVEYGPDHHSTAMCGVARSPQRHGNAVITMIQGKFTQHWDCN